MRESCVLEIPPVLSAHRGMPNILVLVNYAAGRDELAKALYEEGS
jgi:hypothetical protein